MRSLSVGSRDILRDLSGSLVVTALDVGFVEWKDLKSAMRYIDSTQNYARQKIKFDMQRSIGNRRFTEGLSLESVSRTLEIAVNVRHSRQIACGQSTFQTQLKNLNPAKFTN